MVDKIPHAIKKGQSSSNAGYSGPDDEFIGQQLASHQMPRLTGERPTPGSTPDSLLALHRAGYRELSQRIQSNLVVDLGCGLGIDSISLSNCSVSDLERNEPTTDADNYTREHRTVIGVDYDPGAAIQAFHRFKGLGFVGACMNASNLAFRSSSIAAICSSHLIEHFANPELHVGEVARVLADHGTAFFLAPNATADFENPFHLTSFNRSQLLGLLGQFFHEVWVGGLDGNPRVKADIGARRVKANKLLALDIFKLRHKLPKAWYVHAYTKILPLTYRLVARNDSNGNTGITEDDFYVSQDVDETTLVLFAIALRPKVLASPIVSYQPSKLSNAK